MFAGTPSWTYSHYFSMQVEAHDLPIVVVWVGGGGIDRYNEAAFARGLLRHHPLLCVRTVPMLRVITNDEQRGSATTAFHGLMMAC
jgi:hypothetical protein